MTNDDVIYEATNGIGVITLNRPQARNAFTHEMYEDVARICTDVPTDGSIKCLIVRGAGDKAFAAGTDISLFRDFKTEKQALDYEHKMDAILTAIESCPVPTIAAINGACTGGGAAVAAVLDIRITSETLKFGFPISRTLGNCLSVPNLARLSLLLGAGRAKEILFTSRLIGAEEALSIGLVSEVLLDNDAVMARAMELAEMLSERAPLTMRATKEGFRRLLGAAQDVDDADLIVQCYTSNDFREGMEAFLGKRKPEFTGT